MRKLIATISALVFVTVLSYGQKKIDLSTAEPYVLELKDEVYMGGGKMPFKEIIVKDYRFDTTKYGYIRVKGTRKMVFDVNSSVAFSTLANNYFKAHLDPAADKSLVIVIKTFWLQQGTVDLESDEKIYENWGWDDKTGACHASFDVFAASNNEYKALLRMEYEFMNEKYRSQRLKQLFFAPFDSVANRINAMDVEKTLSGKKNFSSAALDQNYQSRFDLPVLKGDAPERGVFLTFADFTQNKLSHPEFVSKEGGLTDELYIGKDGKQLLLDYWGFFDGKDYYIHIGFNFFKMVRQNNTFDLWGAKNITRSTQSYNYDYRNTLTVQQTKVDLKPLQLDMALGEVY